jgi:hypothetical protein
MLMRAKELCVLHLAALKDHEALEMLCHTTQVIAAQGVSQVLLALEQGPAEETTRLAGVAAQVRRLGCGGLTFVGKLRLVQTQLARLLREKTLYAVHLHGAAPCVLGALALKGSPLQGRVLFSPHLRRFGAPWPAALLSRLLQRQLPPLDFAAVAASLTEAQALSRLFNRSADVLPHRVADVFFEVPRRESRPPGIAADGFGAKAVDLVSRLCVLLNGREARVGFSWLGPAEPGSLAQLRAANVQVPESACDAARAEWLSRATAFVHVSPAERVPLAVAQAMAAGTPCLVSDTPAHRALIRHGETGYVCTSERDFLEKTVLLLREPGERQRIAEAAQAEAARRFTLRHFETAILRAYGFSAARTPAGTALVRDELRLTERMHS